MKFHTPSTHHILLILSVIFTVIPTIYSMYHSFIVHSLFCAFLSILSLNHHYLNDFVNDFNSSFTTPWWSVYGCYMIYNIVSTFNIVFYIYIVSYVILVYKIAMIQFEYSKLHKEEKWVSFYVYYLCVLSTSQILCVWNVVSKDNR